VSILSYHDHSIAKVLENGGLNKIIEGNITIVLEPTRDMKAIASLLGYMVPMKLGV